MSMSRTERRSVVCRSHSSNFGRKAEDMKRRICSSQRAGLPSWPAGVVCGRSPGGAPALASSGVDRRKPCRRTHVRTTKSSTELELLPNCVTTASSHSLALILRKGCSTAWQPPQSCARSLPEAVPHISASAWHGTGICSMLAPAEEDHAPNSKSAQVSVARIFAWNSSAKRSAWRKLSRSTPASLGAVSIAHSSNPSPSDSAPPSCTRLTTSCPNQRVCCTAVYITSSSMSGLPSCSPRIHREGHAALLSCCGRKWIWNWPRLPSRAVSPSSSMSPSCDEGLTRTSPVAPVCPATIWPRLCTSAVRHVKLTRCRSSIVPFSPPGQGLRSVRTPLAGCAPATPPRGEPVTLGAGSSTSCSHVHMSRSCARWGASAHSPNTHDTHAFSRCICLLLRTTSCCSSASLRSSRSHPQTSCGALRGDSVPSGFSTKRCACRPRPAGSRLYSTS